jgi:hypothetical protein
MVEVLAEFQRRHWRHFAARLFDLNWLRMVTKSILIACVSWKSKHGRIGMLAVVGYFQSKWIPLAGISTAVINSKTSQWTAIGESHSITAAELQLFADWSIGSLCHA